MDLSNEKMNEMYKTMLKIRFFEESLNKLTASGTVSGFVHLYIGEEAVAAGVCATLRDSDYITSTHRGHGHLIAKGGKTDLMMAELFAKRTGYCMGKGGSMHIADIELGILGANGIVGGGPPLAVGAALAAQYNDTDNVCACFFGDGASNQGTVHEAMNLASLWKLPVIFVVENNGYAEMTSQAGHQVVIDVADRGYGYKIPAVVVDGNDIMAVYEATSEAVLKARKGEGPAIIECKTYRHSGHYVGDPEVYRDKDEVESWKRPEKDPIVRFENLLLEKKILNKEEVEKIKSAVGDEIDKAVAFAEQSPHPDPNDLMVNVYAE